jgi:thiamine biosynthesis lipoprotein
MLQTGIAFYHETHGAVNIAIGPVTALWREGTPDMPALLAANAFTHIRDIVINEEEGTVFLPYAGMRLDVGSIGKGYAIEQAVQRTVDAGFTSFVLSVGGDILAAGAPRSEGRDAWRVGIRDPFSPGDIIDTVSIKNTAVFTSGDYFRPYHIIDPRTLSPAAAFSSASVVHPSATVAEILSLAIFILDIDEGKRLLARYDAEAIWVRADGTVVTTEGYYNLK